MSEPALLELKDLVKVYPVGGIFSRKRLRAVDNVSFTMPSDRATIATLAGESGSGKSTIARIVLGLIKPTSGEVRYKGRNLAELSRKGRLAYNKEVGAVFQDPYGTYNPFYKVDRIFSKAIKKFKLASSDADRDKLILHALSNVGLTPEEVLGRYPHQLSGGQRQRIMLARALLIGPSMIVADEPVSMIDASLRAGILNVVRDLRDKHGMSCLFITHDLSVARYLSDSIVILYRGRALERGSTDLVIEKPAHPYSQLLIGSVPLPDPKKRWKERIELDAKDLLEVAGPVAGCVFYERCPQAGEKCLKEMPPSVEVEHDHVVSCHQYS